MSLNIKNEHVHAMAREAARLTGRTQTGAIEAALTDYLARLTADDRRTRADRLIDAMHARLTPEMRVGFDTADLYDDDGLPA